ncbi:GumC family protein [Granulicella tundricola]|uniref:GumC family protein n=1 Tax=Granulicella tundricola TaxID=940615 RepID=UPI0022B73915|nr:Wzz/FepE/Etk N-terminal domain-containing protein [Granulicella tundricola]
MRARQANWVANATLLWDKRTRIARTAVISLVAGLAIAFAIPKEYEASARIMPPDQGGGGAALLSALAGHGGGALGSLGSLAGGLLGGHNTSALFVDLLQSGTVSSHLIDRFQLQHAYHKRYRIDTAKYLARHTKIVEDKKSGVISITVEDTQPQRARDLTQAYLEELNKMVTQTSISSARQERIFIERRLQSVQRDLENAQLAMSDFSSSHTTIDIKEQTRAMVDAAAKLQGQLIVGQSELGSLEQIYGDGNVRVRAAQARVSALQKDLKQMSGTDAPLPAQAQKASSDELYPPLRQLPRLAVPYADLYRRVRVQETVFELLTQEYEMARIQEAKDIPVISVIDAPGLPEKKSYPPRLLVALGIMMVSCIAMSALILLRRRWEQMSEADPRKVLMRTVQGTLPLSMRGEGGRTEMETP